MTDTPEVLWRPHPGPQTAFLSSPAYEVLYGGQVGGGKSDCLLFGNIRQSDHPAYKGLILRRTFPELRELMDRSLAVFGQLGGEWNEQAKRWKWPAGGYTEFGYCETYKDAMQYMGKQFSDIAFDEIGMLAEERIWTFLMTRNRAAGTGLRLTMRASANPGGAGHHWLKRRFIDRCPNDGTPIETSYGTRAFVRATIQDNPTLMANDPMYVERLKNLPELEYRWLALGDWNAGGGLAFPELAERERYLIPPQRIPDHWRIYAAFDWGYSHPFAFGLFACDEDGNIYLVDSVHGRRLQPPEIAARWRRTLDQYALAGRCRMVVAGHDCWADIKARGERTPTLAEQFQAEGFTLVRANVSRIAGVQNMRAYFAPNAGPRPDWRQLGPHAPLVHSGTPRFRMFDTVGNRKTLEVLDSRICDPDDIEDVMKTDADEHGIGGDDAYDMIRYGLAARPIRPNLGARFRDDGAPHHDPSVLLRTVDGRPPKWIGPEHEAHDGGGTAPGGYAEQLPVGIA